jgi:hypothetical protein
MGRKAPHLLSAYLYQRAIKGLILAGFGPGTINIFRKMKQNMLSKIMVTKKKIL